MDAWTAFLSLVSHIQCATFGLSNVVFQMRRRPSKKPPDININLNCFQLKERERETENLCKDEGDYGI